MNKSYYTKDTVYGDDPLKEVLYELEDMRMTMIDTEMYFGVNEVLVLMHRHLNTVNEFNRRAKDLKQKIA